MDPRESEAYRKLLEAQLKLRTEQLGQAVAKYEALMNLVREAVPALRKVDNDPAVSKLVERFDNNSAIEKTPANLEATEALMAQINAGAPIPAVPAIDVKQIWHAIGLMNAARPLEPGVAIGLSAFAAYGVECAAEPARFMSAHWRHTVLSDLIERGALNEWIHDGQPDDKVFAAAAMVHCTLEDIGRATVKAIAKNDAEFAAHAAAALRAQGYDPEHPEIEGRFGELLRG